MKKFCILLFVAASLTTFTAQAQQNPDLRSQAVEDTRRLAQKISLDDARTPQVKRLTYERLVQENEAKQMYSIDPAMLQSKLAVIEKEYTEKLKGVLSDAQYQRYVVVITSTAVVAPPTVAAAPVAAPVAPKAPAPAAKAPVPPKAKTSLAQPAKKVVSGNRSRTIASRP